MSRCTRDAQFCPWLAGRDTDLFFGTVLRLAPGFVQDEGPPVTYEDPQSLLARLRLGREEFAQRLLTSLILGGPYPRWNTRNIPSTAGVAFLRALDQLCFGQPGEPASVFVDELDLPRRHEDERGGAPDQAVLWDDRLWLIELKTEPGSHRRDQLPYYFELGAHHFPAARVDITYLTSQMSVATPDFAAPNRYAHVTGRRRGDRAPRLGSIATS